MDRKLFFSAVRKNVFGGRLTAKQADGLTRILDYREKTWPGMPTNELAYLLGTVKWETAHTMQPIREGGGEAYLRSKKYYPWVGEGLVQVTWEKNHRKFGATAPGQLLTWPIALRAAFEGMIFGIFTGKKLSDYFSATKSDWVGARRIINGTDQAKKIADISEKFYEALKLAGDAAQKPKPQAKMTEPIVVKQEAREASPPPDAIPVPTPALPPAGLNPLTLLAIVNVVALVIGAFALSAVLNDVKAIRAEVVRSAILKPAAEPIPLIQPDSAPIPPRRKK